MEPASPGERIRPSAVVILYRRGPELEVFLAERSQKTRFFPGYHAFPGGVLEEGEDRARAALRELEEETGVRIADTASLRQAATLLTPPFGPTRYDTTFFVGEMPADQEAKVDGTELVSGRWWTPRDALHRWERDAMPLPPPTLAFLRALAATDDPARLADEALALDGSPHHERFRIEMHPGIYVLPLRAPTLPPATTQNCYLIDGDPILVVDPGSPRPDAWPALFHTLGEMTKARGATGDGRRAMGDDAREVHVVLTHHHADHVGALAALREKFDVTVFAHHATMDRLPRHAVDAAIEDGHVFDLGVWADRPWRVRALHTPGHAPGHMALRDERWGAILAGDLVSGVSTILIDPEEGDMAQYMASLQRCAGQKPFLVLPGHGPALPGGAFAKTLEHRVMREQKALAALTSEPREVAELVPKVYDDTPREAWGLAARSLESVYRKLEGEGKARRVDASRWAATGA